MEKKIRKIVIRVLLLVLIDNLLLDELTTGSFRSVWRFLFVKSPFSWYKARLLIERFPDDALRFAVFIILLFASVLILISLIRWIFDRPSEDKKPVTRRTKPSAVRETKRSVSWETERPAAGRKGDQNLSHSYKNGRDRYLEQLDGFLKDGLVTKQEYDEIREKYEKSGH